ncbi:MAG: hypothetical protein ABSG15_15295 [FCB group bacterium]
MSAAPENFIYNSASQTLTWELIPDADEYKIEYTLVDPENWADLYIGTRTICPFQYPQGQYFVRGSSRSEGTWSLPGKPHIINV